MSLPVWLKRLALCSPLLLTACAGDEGVDYARPAACPDVKILADAERLVKLGPDNQVQYEARIIGYTGECRYQDDGGRPTSTTVDMTVGIDVVRPVDDQEKRLAVPYFAAVISPDQRILGKQLFVLDAGFEAQETTRRFADRPLSITIPVTGDNYPADYRIMLGFQLTPQEMAYNRRNAGQ
ncbi:MAG: hypothetical protein ACPGO3_04800 [Magnetospiraceae bacterium]